jgi:hypothetical protein
LGISKLHKESGACPNPAVWWPASSPYVVAAGGTRLQDGWAWNPSGNDAFTSTGAFNPAYWACTGGGRSEAVWNESDFAGERALAGNDHQFAAGRADAEGAAVAVLESAEYAGDLAGDVAGPAPADHHPPADVGGGEPGLEPEAHAGQPPAGPVRRRDPGRSWPVAAPTVAAVARMSPSVAGSSESTGTSAARRRAARDTVA